MGATFLPNIRLIQWILSNEEKIRWSSRLVRFEARQGISVDCTQRCKGLGDAGHPACACASGTKSACLKGFSTQYSFKCGSIDD